MSQGLDFLLYFITIVIAVVIGLKSLSILASLRREKREVKTLLDDQLAREIKKAIVSEVIEGKISAEGESEERESLEKDPLAGLLMDMYDDLYSRVGEEEKARKKSITELKGEIEKLRSELEKQK